MLSIVKRNVDDLLNKTNDKTNYDEFLDSYKTIFSVRDVEIIETQINNVVEECNALDDIISVSEYSQSFNLNSDHIVRNATSVVIKLKLNNKFKNYVNIIDNWKNNWYKGEDNYLTFWNDSNGDIKDTIINDKYKWTPMSEITQNATGYITGGGSGVDNVFFNVDMDTNILKAMSKEKVVSEDTAILKYNEPRTGDETYNFKIQLVDTTNYLSAREINNFYSGLAENGDDYETNKIDAITYAYLSEDDIKSLINKQDFGSLEAKYDEILKLRTI